ncbi:MAG: tetratricopeptide repeat protein [Caulobacteraceae bacterium]|nr:tetratricopeptide repeat protein [Caulobacteraceae bacterium]
MMPIIMICACFGASTVDGKDLARGKETQLSAAGVKTTIQLARAARSSGDLSAALGLYRRIAGKGADPAVQVEYADTLLQSGLIDDAIGVYQGIDPRSKAGVDALLGLQRCYVRLSEPQKALEYAQRATTLAPHDERAQVDLGVALDAAGRHGEAQASYRLALAVEPRSVAARNDLALSLAITGQYQEAIELLTPMAKSANATPRVRQNLALIYGLKGDRDQAMALSRADLDAPAADGNQRFFDFVRGRGK